MCITMDDLNRIKEECRESGKMEGIISTRIDIIRRLVVQYAKDCEDVNVDIDKFIKMYECLEFDEAEVRNIYRMFASYFEGKMLAREETLNKIFNYYIKSNISRAIEDFKKEYSYLDFDSDDLRYIDELFNKLI